MLKMTIMDWKARIDRQFEAGLFDDVTIGGKRKTQEITNFEFCLIPQEIVLKVSPPIEEEIVERDFVILKSLEMYDKYLIGDLLTRQAAFVNNYDGKDNHCIAYFHHYVRNNKYCLNVYVRSMNYIDNFIFDCQTFNLAYKEVFSKLQSQYKNVEQGFIKVNVFSLHIYK